MQLSVWSHFLFLKSTLIRRDHNFIMMYFSNTEKHTVTLYFLWYIIHVWKMLLKYQILTNLSSEVGPVTNGNWCGQDVHYRYCSTAYNYRKILIDDSKLLNRVSINGGGGTCPPTPDHPLLTSLVLAGSIPSDCMRRRICSLIVPASAMGGAWCRGGAGGTWDIWYNSIIMKNKCLNLKNNTKLGTCWHVWKNIRKF